MKIEEIKQDFINLLDKHCINYDIARADFIDDNYSKVESVIVDLFNSLSNQLEEKDKQIKELEQLYSNYNAKLITNNDFMVGIRRWFNK